MINEPPITNYRITEPIKIYTSNTLFSSWRKLHETKYGLSYIVIITKIVKCST